MVGQRPLQVERQIVELVARDRFKAIDELGQPELRTLLIEFPSVECLSKKRSCFVKAYPTRERFE